MSDPLLQTQDLHLEFKTSRGTLKALNGISLEVNYGEVFGIVGETGCGKTVTGLSILKLLPDSATITKGEILFEGTNLLALSQRQMRKVRGGLIAMIFQDPSASLNPVYTIGRQMIWIISQHSSLSHSEVVELAKRTLEDVGLPDVDRIMSSYPFQLSGGMQQRVMIAIALACKPKLIIADEPTTALDVTIQAQILALLKGLRDNYNISVVLITHSLGVIAKTCDRLAVLYAGHVVETGTTREIFKNPEHPYTRGLIRAIPKPEKRGSRMVSIPGNVPANPGAIIGCPFAPRCEFAMNRCFEEKPKTYQIEEGHYSACFLALNNKP
jgi:oligopeptide/dipeptide ABC transporter ATP-binding protein